MKQLKEIARAQRGKMYALVMISILLGVVIVAQAYFIVAIVDSVFLQRESFQAVLPLLIGLIVVLIGRAVFSYLNGRIGVNMAAKVKKDFRESLLRKYAKNPIQAALKGQSGEKVSILMDAVDEIDSYFSKYYPQIIQTSVVPLIILVTVFYYNWVSGLIMLITAPFIPIFMIIIGMATQKKSEEQLEKLAAFSGQFLDKLQGLATLKLFGRAKEQREVIQKSSLEYRDATMTVLKTAFTQSLMLEFISMLSIALIALEVGLRLVIYEQLTFFIAFIVLVLAPEFYNSLKELGSAFHTGRGSMGAAKKVTEELEEKDKPISWGERSLVKHQPIAISLQNVSFSYENSGFSLQEIKGEFPSTREVAIIGRSGSGKTTLLHILSGLLNPLDGAVLVNGHPLFEYKEKDWFDQLSYISQDPYLFAGTIRDNIAIGGTGNESDQEIELAAEKAGISEMVRNLEKGFNTAVGEAGRGLSGGEKQRIALARAFLKQPSLILFDEPTVGLDLKTEQILQQSMKELAKTSTIITVAHRLHTIRKADQILLLEKGQLLATGTHEELLSTNPHYREMVSAQGGEAQ
ncbi:thiol reductant ABC exporter subunit CydD [Evansella sp. AB-rgal1]|uniref:thiol reductant ABC exporter subunit CydD n=1 Tax=Evansella sp. AB-rgal1 TaxID=3242696 RepID=UPI00359D0A5B